MQAREELRQAVLVARDEVTRVMVALGIDGYLGADPTPAMVARRSELFARLAMVAASARLDRARTAYFAARGR